MSNNPVDELLGTFMDQVEHLAHRYESLRETNQKLQQKVQTLQERISELKNEKDALQKEMDQKRLEFSELAGSLENRLNQIKEEASDLMSDPNNE